MRFARRSSIGVLSVVLLACTPLVVAPPPEGVRRITVLPPNNRTGGELFIEPPVLLPTVFGDRPRATVLDVLAEEARAQIARRGFHVADPAEVRTATGDRVPRDPRDAARIAAASGLEGAALYIEVSVWDPDEESRPSYVTAKVDLVLVDPTTERVLWEAHWPARPVPAGGTGTISLAYPIAARDLLTRMTANLNASGEAEDHDAKHPAPAGSGPARGERRDAPATGGGA
jgi:hypothetical protein